MYLFLADVIVAVHLAYVATVVIGLLLILLGILFKWSWIRNPWFRCIHLLMIAIVAYEAYYEITCPLTDWEHDLRVAAGQPAQEGTFTGRLLGGLLFYSRDSAEIRTAGYYVFAGLVAATFLIAPPRFRRRRPALAPLVAPPVEDKLPVQRPA